MLAFPKRIVSDKDKGEQREKTAVESEICQSHPRRAQSSLGDQDHLLLGLERSIQAWTSLYILQPNYKVSLVHQVLRHSKREDED